jgi:hypothetical protein
MNSSSNSSETRRKIWRVSKENDSSLFGSFSWRNNWSHGTGNESNSLTRSIKLASRSM